MKKNKQNPLPPAHIFDKSEIFKNEIQSMLDEIVLRCSIHRIPFFWTAAIKNDNETTEYTNEAVAPGSREMLLKDNKINKHMLVAAGFDVVPKNYSFEVDIAKENDLALLEETENAILNLNKDYDKKVVACYNDLKVKRDKHNSRLFEIMEYLNSQKEKDNTVVQNNPKISEHTGIHAVSVSRNMSFLVKEGLIEKKGKKIILTNKLLEVLQYKEFQEHLSKRAALKEGLLP